MSLATESVRRNRGSATHDLYWLADLPGLGGSTFFVRQTASSSGGGGRTTSVMSQEGTPQSGDFTIENEVCTDMLQVLRTYNVFVHTHCVGLCCFVSLCLSEFVA